jgi:hypothetical protein
LAVEAIRLKLLLQQRHWQTHSAFCREYDRVARKIDRDLVGTHPSRAQFHRWLSGEVKRLPHPHHCRMLEEMLPGWTANELFERGSPDDFTAATHASRDQLPVREAASQSPHPPAPDGRIGPPDLVKAYAARGLVARTEWNDIIRGAQETIWLYGMSELGYALDDEVPNILAGAAAKGCVIRILLLDPTYAGTSAIDADEGSPAGTLSPRIRAALARFNKMRQRCREQLHIRTYNAPPSVSIVRADSRMLVTPYLRFFVGSNSPTLELKEAPAGTMFERYVRHFEAVWDTAQEWGS